MKKREQKKIEYLISHTFPKPRLKLESEAIYAREIGGYFEKCTFESHKTYNIIYDYFESQGITEQKEIIKAWFKIRNDNPINLYRLKPIRERKDNKDTINYGRGRGSNNPIRYPKKCRSAATWRRFYKLFPHLKKTQ